MARENPQAVPKDERLMSLDAFRGAAIAAMILVNNPGNWKAVYPPLLHSVWHGWTFTDLIFPSFLWIAGVAMTLSFSKRMERGDDRRKLFFHVLERSAILFGLGFIFNLFPRFDFVSVRIPGVLPRIAVCYLAAGVILLRTRLLGQILWTVFLLAVYWILMTLVPVPGFGPGVLSKEGNLARYVDSLVFPGHMWSQTKVWDPEGILSTLPAIATTLFGVLAGHILRLRCSLAEKTAWLFMFGAAALAAGSLMSFWMPINKNLWTSSFSVFMAGMSATGFALSYWLVDGNAVRAIARPFVMFGMNAIAIYVLSDFVGDCMENLRFTGAGGALVSLRDAAYRGLAAAAGAPRIASLLYAIGNVLSSYLLAWGMYRRKWFIKF